MFLKSRQAYLEQQQQTQDKTTTLRSRLVPIITTPQSFVEVYSLVIL